VIVVADTSPITALLRVGQAELVSKLFREIAIPAAVQHELLRYHDALPEWLMVRVVEDQIALAALKAQLDAGEAEAIILAQEIRSDYLLIDERRGRRIALARGLRVIGLVGVVLLAKQRNLISSARDLLEELERTAGVYLSARVREAALKSARE
jgi:predicted nucleic acid-binding protein